MYTYSLIVSLSVSLLVVYPLAVSLHTFLAKRICRVICNYSTSYLSHHPFSYPRQIPSFKVVCCCCFHNAYPLLPLSLATLVVYPLSCHNDCRTSILLHLSDRRCILFDSFSLLAANSQLVCLSSYEF